MTITTEAASLRDLRVREALETIRSNLEAERLTHVSLRLRNELLLREAIDQARRIYAGSRAARPLVLNGGW